MVGKFLPDAGDGAVQLHVLLPRPFPRVIDVHHLLLHPLPPRLPLVIVPQRAIQRTFQRAVIRTLEHEPVLLAVGHGRIVHVVNGIRQPAGFSNDRQRAVAHRDHLR